jgi:SAM-dependent methyltransferase
MSKPDLFGDRAEDYARHRPTYPEALFDHLERLAPSRARAWDCGAGSGQSSLSLARRFDHVFATDSSVRQLVRAAGNPRLHVVAAAAEAAPFRDRSVDLITVSAAVHWFDRPRFYSEVARVARPGAIVAVWSYYASLIKPGVDELIIRFGEEVVGSHWPPGFSSNRNGYRDLDFPFESLTWPKVEAEGRMRLEDLLAYMRTWSASQAYEREKGVNPVEIIRPEMTRAWGDPAVERAVRWPLHGAIGRVGGS